MPEIYVDDIFVLVLSHVHATLMPDNRILKMKAKDSLHQAPDQLLLVCQKQEAFHHK